MIIKSIKNQAEYEKALKLLEEIGDNPKFEEDNELIETFNSLFELIKSYEDLNYAIQIGHPIDVIKLKMEYLNLKAKDLIPYIGSKGLVSDVLNRKRKLSKKMIRNLSQFLKIDQEILNMEYECVLDEKNIQKSKRSVTWEISEEVDILVQKFQEKVRNRGLLFNICPS